MGEVPAGAAWRAEQLAWTREMAAAGKGHEVYLQNCVLSLRYKCYGRPLEGFRSGLAWPDLPFRSRSPILYPALLLVELSAIGDRGCRVSVRKGPMALVGGFEALWTLSLDLHHGEFAISSPKYIFLLVDSDFWGKHLDLS